MFSFLLALTVAAGAELPISVSLPAGAASPTSLQVEWTDKDGRPINEERSSLRGSKLVLAAPGAATGIRVVGGGFSSRAVAISDFPRLGSLALEPTGLVEVSGLRGKEGGTFLWIAAGPSPRPDRASEPRIPDHIRERLAEVQPGVAQLELPIGKYVLAVDPGDGSEPIVFPEIQVEPKTRASLIRPAENGRSLTLLARDRDSRKPVRDVLLSATTDSPRGRGTWYVKKPAPENYAGEDDIQIRILSGEFRVHLRERKTQTPVPHCKVQVRAVWKDGGQYTTIESDDDGVATFSGIGSSAVRFVPQCDGYVHGTGENFDFDEGTPREETIFVDRAQDIVLTIVDRNGSPVSGAHVQAQDVANYHGDDPHLHVNDYLDRVVEVGTSGPDGKLLVKGADWAEVPFFTVASGKALTVARFPSMRSCEDAPECSMTVALPSPNPFPGILLRPSAEGRVLTPNGVFFELAGIPIPAVVFREAIALNGMARDAAFQISPDGVLCLLPALLADGDYDVFVRKRFDPRTGGGMLRIGRVRVPATDRLALTLPEDAAGPNQ